MQELSTTYDAAALDAFFARRPLLVWRRLATVSTSVAALLVRSFLRGGMRGLKSPPGEEVCALLAALGPVAVKAGQTLSTRQDLIGRELAGALSELQMAAPPFPDEVAYALIAEQLDAAPAALYAQLSASPVAAASLGQVYKGTVAQTPSVTAHSSNTAAAGKAAVAHRASNGSAVAGAQEVAVKVQRPDMLGSIALDVYVMRRALGLVRRLARINTDLRAVADEVGQGLFAELDYRVEASQVCHIR